MFCSHEEKILMEEKCTVILAIAICDIDRVLYLVSCKSSNNEFRVL